MLLVDAADLHGQPGDMRLVSPGELAGGGLSTHALSLDMVCQYLRARGVRQAALLAVQPAAVSLGSEASGQILQAVDALASLLVDLCGIDKTAPPA